MDVTNTGNVAGDEVVQLYVSAQGSRVERAPRDLRAFARVHLEPGETKAVPLALAARDLAFWDLATNAFAVEAIRYMLEVPGPEGQAGRHARRHEVTRRAAPPTRVLAHTPIAISVTTVVRSPPTHGSAPMRKNRTQPAARCT